MKDLNYYKQKIQEKRKQTSFRDFLMEILSFVPVVFYKYNNLISKFPPWERVQVISIDAFNSSRDRLIEKSNNYNLDESFLKNFQNLFQNIQLPALFHYWITSNCDFSEVAFASQNCYLSNIIIKDCENIFYSFMTRMNCHNIYNSFYTENNSTNIYNCRGTINSYKIFYSSFIKDSTNIYFSSNLTWCQECLFCDDLQNVKYYIRNKALKKEEYVEEKRKILSEKSNFEWWYEKQNKTGKSYNNTNVSWNYILESENVENGYYTTNTKNSRNILFAGSPAWCENFYDAWPAGGNWWTDFYAVAGAWDWSQNLYCCAQIWSSSNMFYCYYMEGCSYCLGCIGLTNKSYCILNKQYSKADWEIVSSQIFESMEQDWTLWEFFPWEINPYYLNDTVAGILWDFSKQEAQKKGYMWRDEEIKVDIPEWVEIIKVSELDDFEWFNTSWEWKINPEILEKVIVDKSGNYYKIVQMEYDFLIKHWLPLPRLHWLDRMKLNFWV